MSTAPKTRPNRPLMPHSTAQLKELAKASVSSPQRLAAVYFELQFRSRKAATELREYVRFLLSAVGHPFRWPSTDAPPARNALAQGVFEIDIGLLRTMGYRVGVEGIGESKRRAILDDIYLHELYLLRGHPQQKQWGKPQTAERLRRLANTIAAFTRNAKRMRQPALVAIAEWEADLRYLRKTHYAGVYDFQWPSTINRPT